MSRLSRSNEQLTITGTNGNLIGVQEMRARQMSIGIAARTTRNVADLGMRSEPLLLHDRTDRCDFRLER